MIIKNERDIIQLVQEDTWMMDILQTAKTLQLPDWWVCAGFVRSKIWDVLHGFSDRTPLPDVDVVYFDPNCCDEVVEKELEKKLFSINPHVPWSVKNEARMHLINNMPPFTSSVDAIANFPETVTSLGLTLGENNQLILTAPHGIQDVIDMTVRPTPYYLQSKDHEEIYEGRVMKKNWSKTWHQVKVIHIQEA
ncbi:nucleotidyltransferase family protein [Paenibacillus dokdonensis]|uniref:Nucleotidyltransferase family protein n=1 Tax=Paenibacillus dokdonensis TaxID=2567944 RepID=A0ABU6GKJ8_9BACL|nr:nucleotidyltransferase family protein [Paenibacillus dokdonensis]MEC0239637.1 nucleotidyltransferase family protein [Paenibacillus dokdonensis]